MNFNIQIVFHLVHPDTTKIIFIYKEKERGESMYINPLIFRLEMKQRRREENRNVY